MMKRVTFLAFTFVVLTIIGWNRAEGQSENKLSISEALRMAHHLLDASRLREAKRLLDQIVEADREGLVSVDMVHVLSLYGAVAHNGKQLDEAISKYTRALELIALSRGSGDEGFLKINIARATWELGRREESLRMLDEMLASPQTQGKAAVLNTRGVFAHALGKDEDAIRLFKTGLALDDAMFKIEILFNLAVSLKTVGRHGEAGDVYLEVLRAQPDNIDARMNLAALYHEHQMFPQAIAEYGNVIHRAQKAGNKRIEGMARGNLGMAYHEFGDGDKAIATFEAALASGLDSPKEIASTMVNLNIARRAICDWKSDDHDLEWILNQATLQLEAGNMSSLLPFDTLTRPVDPKMRIRIAKRNAANVKVHETGKYERFSNAGSPSDASARRVLSLPVSPLRVGYFSYDYSQHPTAHLAEGLFVYHNKSRATAVALSFGKDDGSEYRKRIIRDCDEFVNFAESSYAESVDVIQSRNIHVLMDMQGFTRGGRPEVCAARPAPIIVNYLVYPGTSGSSFTDYFIGDKIVAPPENAWHFTERIIYHPDCYQVNYFDVHVPVRSPTALILPEPGVRPAELPPDGTAFVFCNFNKSDKLDLTTFGAWMNILRRTPGSILWLLEPSRRNPTGAAAMKERLLTAAASFGILPDRIVFAPRVPKRDHLKRHHHADLFLDSFTYGAHSTATDALRAGLPLLTMAGGDVASRVGVSLLHSMNEDDLFSTFVVHSIKEFEDVAVRIARNPVLARKLRQLLMSRVEKLDHMPPVFDTASYVRNLEVGLMMAWEVWASGNTPMHLVAGKSMAH